MSVTLVGIEQTTIDAAAEFAVGVLPAGWKEGQTVVAIHGSEEATGMAPPIGWDREPMKIGHLSAQVSWITLGSSAPNLTWTAGQTREQVLTLFLFDGAEPNQENVMFAYTLTAYGQQVPVAPATGVHRDGSFVLTAYIAKFDTLCTDIPAGFTATLPAISTAGGGISMGVAHKVLTLADGVPETPWAGSIDNHYSVSFGLNAAYEHPLPGNAGSALFAEDAWGITEDSGPDVTTPVPPTTKIGDLLIYGHACDNTEAIVMAGFNIFINQGYLSSATLVVGWRIATASDVVPGATHTSGSGSSESRTGHIVRYTNAHPTAPINAVGVATGTGFPNCPSVETTVDGALIVHAYAAGGNIPAGPGFTGGATGLRNMASLWRSTVGCVSGSDLTLQAAQGVTVAKTWGGRSLQYIGATYAIAPAPGGSPDPGAALDPIFLAGML